MLRTTLAGLRAHRLRLLLTALAITLGVGFIVGTFVLTDTMRAGYNQQFAASADKVDVAVLPKGSTGSAGQSSDEPELPADLLTRIRALPGVTDAQGKVSGTAPLIDKDGRTYGDVSTVGVSLPSEGPLRRYTMTSGRAPVTAGEAALDEGVAEQTGFKVGDRIQVLDRRNKPQAFQVVGIVDLGIDSDINYRGAVAFDPATAARMTGKKGYAEIDVAGGVTVGQVRAVTGNSAGYDVLTGAELSKRLAKSAGTDLTAVMASLLIFGIISLLVAALVIYNTFTILIAQRVRELALLRCVGATRRQVFGGVLVESVVVGLVGSVLGIAVGSVLGLGGVALFKALGDFPSGSFTLTPRTAIVALLVGVTMTVVSALLPARNATKVAPMAALRAQQEPGGGRFRLGLPAWAVTVLFGGLGIAATVLGLVVVPPGQAAMFVIAGGAALVFIAVVAVMPLLVRPLSRVIGWVPARLAGVPGRLATQNAWRTPRRTATTTIALTVGVGLVSLFTVVGASAKATASHQIDQQFPVDYRLHTGANLDQTIPRALAATLRQQPQVSSVTEVRTAETRFAGGKQLVGDISQASLGVLVKPSMKYGSVQELRRSGTVMVGEDFAKRKGLSAGERVGLRTRLGTVQVTVAAIYSGEDFLLPEVVLPEADFGRYFGPRGDTAIYLKVRAGVSDTATRAAINNAVRPYPTVKVSSARAMKAEFSSAIDTLLLIFAGLLGLAVLIALFGIANTLTLSVVERTRESALLRALGLTKRQLRGMLSVEAVIMSVIGALVGVALGIAFGWAATRAFGGAFLFRLPYAQILGFIALAAVAGLLAAALPARRAAKTSIVDALAAD